MLTLIGNIITSSGKNYLTAVNAGGLGPNNNVALNTNRTAAAAWETFNLILQPGSPVIGPGMKFALQTSDGNNYLTAINGGGKGGANDATCPVHTDATSAGVWETFTLLINNNVKPPTIQIKPFFINILAPGYYVTAVNGGGIGAADPENTQPVHTNATVVGAWEVFSLSGAPVPNAPVVIAFNANLNGPQNGNIAGSMTVTMAADGSYNFSGKMNNSNWLPDNLSVAVVVVAANGTAFTFSCSGSVDAALPWDDNNIAWNIPGINGAI